MVSIVSALLLLLVGSAAVYIIIKCKDPKWVKGFLSFLAVILVLSLAGFLTVTVGCMETVAKMEPDTVENARSAYFSFMLVGGVFALIIFIIVLSASLIRHKFLLARTLVAYIGALAEVTVISPMFCMLFNLFGVNINIYVELLALCLGVICASPVAIDVYRLMKRMSTPEGLCYREKETCGRRRRTRR